MDVYELVRQYKKHNPDGHYFDHDTLKFFGECFSNMKVFKRKAVFDDRDGNLRTCYVLSSLQRDFAGNSRRKYTYFDVDTFEEVFV